VRARTAGGPGAALAGLVLVGAAGGARAAVVVEAIPTVSAGVTDNALAAPTGAMRERDEFGRLSVDARIRYDGLLVKHALGYRLGYTKFLTQSGADSVSILPHTLAAGLPDVVKVVVGRPRPEALSLGFPSGHSTAAAAFFGAVVYLAGALRPAVSRPVRAAALLAIVLVGLARVMLRGGIAGMPRWSRLKAINGSMVQSAFSFASGYRQLEVPR